MGGKVDAFMMRIVDMMYAIPYLLIAILLVTILGREFYLVVITITDITALSRAETELRQRAELQEAMLRAMRHLG